MVVLVWPEVDDQTSVIPALFRTLLPVSPITRPFPAGAGMSVTLVDPDLPVTLIGTLLPGPCPDSHDQFPRMTGIRLILAFVIAFWIVLATSFPLQMARPT